MNYSTSVPLGAAGSNKARVIGGDEASFREFLANFFGGVPYFTGETTIYVGQLPPEDRFGEYPLPESAQIIGCVVRERGGDEIAFNMPISSEEAVALCEQKLISRKWKFVEPFPFPQAGLIDQVFGQMRRYCNEDLQATLTLSAGGDEGISSIRFHITQETNPCAPRLTHYPMSFDFVPSLVAPANARFVAGGGGGGGTHDGGATYNSAGTLTTQLPVPQIVLAYHDQFDRLGWQKNAEYIGERSAISAWGLSKDKSLTEAYFILHAHVSKTHEYLLWLHVYENLRKADGN